MTTTESTKTNKQAALSKVPAIIELEDKQNGLPAIEISGKKVIPPLLIDLKGVVIKRAAPAPVMGSTSLLVSIHEDQACYHKLLELLMSMKIEISKCGVNIHDFYMIDSSDKSISLYITGLNTSKVIKKGILLNLGSVARTLDRTLADMKIGVQEIWVSNTGKLGYNIESLLIDVSEESQETVDAFYAFRK